MLLFIFNLESVVFCYCFLLINILKEGPSTIFISSSKKTSQEAKDGMEVWGVGVGSGGEGSEIFF